MTPATTFFASESNSTVLASSEDAGLCTLARRALSESGYPALSALDCQAFDGVITLRGVVKSFYLKQVAQECVRRLADRIENRITVKY